MSSPHKLMKSRSGAALDQQFLGVPNQKGNRMIKHPKWLIGTGTMAAALVVGSMTMTASAATAHIGHPAASDISSARHHHKPRCYFEGNPPVCVYPRTVTGTAWPSNGLNIRSGPGTGYSVVGTMPHDGTGTVFCYATGTDVNGDSYWDDLDSSWGDGYVADTYLYTAGNINDQVNPC
jgi:hypothetical protein